MSRGNNYIIVGAGVIGLSILHQLLLKHAQDKSENIEVTVVAKHYPSDDLTYEYTSPWAGAHFRPFPHRPETYASDERESKYTRATFKFFQQLAKEKPESTIEFMKGIDWLESPSAEYENCGPGYNKDCLLQFRKLAPSKGDYMPQGVVFGCEYLTYCLNAPEYLKFLQEESLKLSQKSNVTLTFVRDEVQSLKQAYEKYSNDRKCCMFNATGMGLLYSGGQDPDTFKIRGQTLLLDVPDPETIQYANKTITHQSNDGLWTFVIKRPPFLNAKTTTRTKHAQYILGGTKQLDDNLTTARQLDTDGLLTRAKKLYPDLIFPDGTFHIVRTNVGFRPARNGGSRVEAETPDPSQPDLQVIHAYGIGGMGFEASVGMAQHALELVHAATSGT